MHLSLHIQMQQLISDKMEENKNAKKFPLFFFLCAGVCVRICLCNKGNTLIARIVLHIDTAKLEMFQRGVQNVSYHSQFNYKQLLCFQQLIVCEVNCQRTECITSTNACRSVKKKNVWMEFQNLLSANLRSIFWLIIYLIEFPVEISSFDSKS